jgi:hypothetical protein
MGLAFLVQPASKDYPNHLAEPEPQRRTLAPAGRWIVLLLLACLVPRVVMAWCIPSINPDGALYIHLARALDAGDLRGGMQGMNVYPIILMGLHRAGLSWELAAKFWGVLVSTLVILPLFGWARRQFDDRVALVACFLYIVHPKFIELSPEVIRDSTFWLLFALSLYLQWRAITEVRIGLFLLAAAATVAACLTRFEGLYLYLPLGLWSLYRFLALRTNRGRLALGALLAVTALPALVLGVNLVWHQARGEWLLPRLDPLERVLHWVQSMLAGTPHLESAPADAAMAGSLSFRRMLWVFFPHMTRGLSPALALLMFGGMWKYRKIWARRDHQALFYTSLVVMLGNWIQLWYDQRMCFRYALPIALIASVFAALGLLSLSDWLVSLAERLRLSDRARRLALVGPSVLVAALGLGAAVYATEQSLAARGVAVTLGHWLRDRCQSPVLVGPEGLTPVTSFYADGRACLTYRLDSGNEDSVALLVEQAHPDVVLLHATKWMNAEQCEGLARRLCGNGLDPAYPPADAREYSGLQVLVRRDASTQRY